MRSLQSALQQRQRSSEEAEHRAQKAEREASGSTGLGLGSAGVGGFHGHGDLIFFFYLGSMNRLESRNMNGFLYGGTPIAGWFS